MDHHLRELARVAATDPRDVESRVALLRERLRAGQLTDERLRLAAHFGDEAAAALIGESPTLFALWGSFFRDYPHLDRDTLIRFALAAAGAARSAMPLPAHAIDGLLAAIAAWRACPCDRHLRDLAPREVAVPNPRVLGKRNRAAHLALEAT